LADILFLVLAELFSYGSFLHSIFIVFYKNNILNPIILLRDRYNIRHNKKTHKKNRYLKRMYKKSHKNKKRAKINCIRRKLNIAKCIAFIK